MDVLKINGDDDDDELKILLTYTYKANIQRRDNTMSWICLRMLEFLRN